MRKDLKVIDAKVLILGFTFKEDCPDVRNTRVIDIYQELKSFDMEVDVYDPWADPAEVMHEYGIQILKGANQTLALADSFGESDEEETYTPNFKDYSAIILAVAHQEFKNWPIQKSENQVVFDVKSVLEKEKVDARLWLEKQDTRSKRLTIRTQNPKRFNA